MLIVSRFHDFYDTASVHGIDKTCVYLRKEEVIDVDRPDTYVHTRAYWPREEEIDVKQGTKWIKLSAYKALVGFCGEIYPFVMIDKSSPGHNSRYFFYSNEKLQEFLLEEEVALKGTSKYWYSNRDISVRSPKSMSEFFDQGNWTKFKEYFVKFNCPVFLYGKIPEYKIDKTFVALNPSLKNLGFMKVKDSQSAFQDIYMFLSGVLGSPPKPTKPIDDKTMAASKGHDGEFSFKRPPGKKTRWR